MNTKQVEELTGISRQNIRYYEKVGLLTPNREKENSYRDYSEDDVERLNMIKFLRMLDMPIEEIAKIFQGECTLNEAVRQQKETLETKQRQLQGAIEICSRICRENGKAQESHPFPVKEYLTQIEYEKNKIGGFAQFKDDYKKIMMADKQKQFSYLVPYPIYSEEELFEALAYATDESWVKQKCKSHLTVMRGETTYEVTKRKLRGAGGQSQSTLIIGNMVHPEQAYDAQIPPKRKQTIYAMHMVGRNIARNKWKSLLTCGIAMMAVLLISIYFGNISNLEQQLTNLPESIPVSGKVYNVCGSKSAGLLIRSDMTYKLQKSKYVTDYRENVELLGKLPGAGDEKYYRVLGINQAKAIPGLLTNQIAWDTAYNWSAWETFLKEKNVCLVEQSLLKNYDLKVGDSIEVHLDCYESDDADPTMKFRHLMLMPLKDVRLKIAGSYKGTDLTSADASLQMIVPLTDVRSWFDEAELTYYASAVSFGVKDAAKLNQLKKELAKEKIKQVDTAADDIYLGDALSIDDGEYIQTASKLQRSLDLLHAFYPLILLVVLVAGIIISYLMIQSRRMEIAIMRMLGSGKQRTGWLIIMEQMIVASIGVLIGILTGLLLHFHIQAAQWGTIALFMVCYFTGSIISIGTVDSNRINTELTHKE